MSGHCEICGQTGCIDCGSEKPTPATGGEVVVVSHGFLSDVMTAAGLVRHGKQCKALANRLCDEYQKIRSSGIKVVDLKQSDLVARIEHNNVIWLDGITYGWLAEHEGDALVLASALEAASAESQRLGVELDLAMRTVERVSGERDDYKEMYRDTDKDAHSLCEEIQALRARLEQVEGERGALVRACRVAVLALAHAAEASDVYQPAYQTMSDALDNIGSGHDD